MKPGDMLGPYRVLEVLGVGGMGEVYEARDTRLDRSVAIKVLPTELSADPERRARFEREAKAIAGLTHPHICTLYDVGEHPSASSGQATLYLVMEHLQGETLAARLEKGPLPLELALTTATEIADALSAAHRQGVVHRDLKPGNVMLTKAGAKLLDFGLAKLTGHGEQPAAAPLATAPTQSTPLTGEGMIVGTLQYMAPEQVEGKPADARTDLWALGAILYEMLSGKRAFEGTSAASLIGSIMHTEPPALATLQPLTPPGVDRLVRQCLAKAPEDRWDTAHDVANELRWLREASGAGALTGDRPGRRRGLAMVLVVAGGLSLIAVGAALMWLLHPSSHVAGLALSVIPADELNAGGVESTYIPTPGGSRTALTWTADGRTLVFVGHRAGVQQLYVRPLDTADARPLAGTEGAQVPAVSPDGQWVAFWAGGAIRKVRFDGGPVMDLASGVASPPWGLVWDAQRGVFFAREDGRIWVVPAEGKPAPVTTVGEAERAHTLPSLLPGGQVLLYTVRKREWSWGDEEVVAQTLDSGARTRLLTDAVDARYVPTGHLVFLRRGVLYAVPFDPARLLLRGPEVPVLGGIAHAVTSGQIGNITGAGQMAIAPTGTLAWIAGSVTPYPSAQLVTVDRRGQVTVLPTPARSYGGRVRVSPDGRRLAATVRTVTEMGLWVHDLARSTPLPLTLEGEVSYPIWWPDGQHLLFAWLRNGRRSLVMQPADGSAAPRAWVSGSPAPSSVTSKGHLAAVTPSAAERDIVIVTFENGKARTEPLIQSPHAVQSPELSPDGHWLLYGSNVTGRDEIWVRPYPGSGGAVPVSIGGGTDPAWHPNGREVFFTSLPDPAGRRRMMAVEFAPGSPPPLDVAHGALSAAEGPRVGRPGELFTFDPGELRLACITIRCYDVAPDGQRFYAVQPVTPPPPPVVTHVNLIPNWFEELKAKVPTGK